MSSSPITPSPSFTLPLSPRNTQLASTLLYQLITREVKRQTTQLQGELRDEYRVKARGVKADFMARVVQFCEEEAEEDEGEVGQEIEQQLARTTLDGRAKWDEAPSPPAEKPPTEPLLPPTILSDTHEVAAMSSAVDAQIEEAMKVQMEEASKRIRERVAEVVGMEVELWIGTALLEARDQAGEDEEAVDRLVQVQLEDRLWEEGVDVPPPASGKQ
ncbi:hypothetical protein JCM11641_001386 [Rhodosporidiobolus odoratus]